MASDKDLFANFERMRREMDELLGDLFDRAGMTPRRGFSPAVDVYYCGEPPRVVVKVELAGIGVQQVSLEVRGRELIITGNRPVDESEGRIFQQVEIERGPFRRAVQLGAEVETDKASAYYEEGILQIELPLKADDALSQVPIRVLEGEQ